MKITKRQLRRIIKEGDNLNELFGFGKKKMNPDGTECKGCKGLKWAQNDVEIQGWQDRYAKSGQWFMKRREDPKFAEPRMPDDEHYMRGWKRGEQDADDEVKYAHIQLKERVTEENAMKISKRQLKRIIKEEKAKLLNEGFRMADIASQAATALENGEPGTIEGLMEQVQGALMPDEDKNAYLSMLEAMANVAYELLDYREDGGY